MLGDVIFKLLRAVSHSQHTLVRVFTNTVNIITQLKPGYQNTSYARSLKQDQSSRAEA
jgi:hypothetical protein